MTQTLLIKRSSSTVAPSSLAAGELAYSSKTGTQKLYIGDGTNVLAIGGKSYTDKLDGIEAGAKDDQTDGEIETAYNNQVSKVNATEITNGTETGVRRYSPADIHSLIDTHAASAYSLPLSTNSVRGGVKIGYTTTGKNYAVQLNNEQMFVNVPWVNTEYTVGDGGLSQNNFTTTLKNKLDGISASANNYTLPVATATAKGGIELFSNTNQSIDANAVTATAGKTYGIQLNSAGQAVVNVPWTDSTPTTAQVQSAGALMDSELANINAVKGINQNLTTTSNVTFGSNGGNNVRVTANGMGIGVAADTTAKLNVAGTIKGTHLISTSGTVRSQGSAPEIVWQDTDSASADISMKQDSGLLTARYHTNYNDEETGTDTAMEIFKMNQWGLSIGSPTDGSSQNVVPTTPSQGVRLHVNGSANVSSNLTVEGNLTVSGTTTTVDTETIKLADNIIELNSNLASNVNASEDAGIEINRGAYTNLKLFWDETNNEWKLQTSADSSETPTTTPILSAANFTTKITTIDGGTF